MQNPEQTDRELLRLALMVLTGVFNDGRGKRIDPATVIQSINTRLAQPAPVDSAQKAEAATLKTIADCYNLHRLTSEENFLKKSGIFEQVAAVFNTISKKLNTTKQTVTTTSTTSTETTTLIFKDDNRNAEPLTMFQEDWVRFAQTKRTPSRA